MRSDMTNKKQHPITKGPVVDRKQHHYNIKIPQVMKVQGTSSRLQNEIRNYFRGVCITTQRLGFRQAQGTFLDLHKFLLLQSSQQAIFPLEGRVSPSPGSNSIRTSWLKESVDHVPLDSIQVTRSLISSSAVKSTTVPAVAAR